MKMLLCRAHLESPVSSRPESLHLDGIMWSASREKRKRQKKQPRLPAWSITLYGHTVTLASAMLPGSWSMDHTAFTKRRDGVDVQHLAGSLHRGLGPGKDKIVKRALIDPGEDGCLEWYCVAGRRRPVYKLLKRALMIGRDIGSGYGRVCRWEVKSLETEDLTPVLVDSDGRAVRNLPPRWCTSYSDTRMGALESPYWEGHEEVVPVGAQVELDPELVRELQKARERPPKPRRTDEKLAQKIAENPRA